MGLTEAGVALLLGCLLSSCAHPPLPAAAKPAPAPPARDPFALTAEWKPEATEAPPGIWLRVKSPAQLLPRVLKLAADPSLMGFSDLKVMAGLALGGELSSLIDLDAPVDLVLARSARAEDRNFLGAAHVADEAHFAPRALGNKLHSVAPGRWEIHPDERNDRVQCELWHAPPPVGYRVVCGVDPDAIARYAPFLLGRLAQEPLASDARFGSAHQPLTEGFGQRRNEQAAEAPISAEDEPAEQWAKSLMSAESIALDLSFVDPDIVLSLELDYPETETPNFGLGRLGGVPQPIPPQFWQARALAPLTLVSTGADDQAMAGLESAWGDSVKAFFEQVNRAAGMSPELGERVTRAMGGLIPHNLRFTFSQPALVTQRSPGPAKPGRAAKGAEASWCLLGFAGSGERYLAGLEVLFQASKAKPEPSSAPTSRWVRLDKRPPDLPPESVLLRTDAPDKNVSFGFVLPSPDWIWLITASTQSELLTQARRLLASSSKPAEPDPVAQAAFAPDPLLAMTLDLVSLKNTFGEQLSGIHFANLPFGGTAPIFVSLAANRRQRGNRGTLSINLRSHWSPAAIADLFGLIKVREALSDKDATH